MAYLNLSTPAFDAQARLTGSIGKPLMPKLAGTWAHRIERWQGKIERKIVGLLIKKFQE